MSTQTMDVFPELIFSNHADHTAVASTASEAGLLSGTNRQPILNPQFFSRAGKALSLRARGVFSTTGTPTMIFQVRLGTTAGPTYYSGTSVGVSAAITTNTITSKWWELNLDIICTIPGIGTGNTTLCCSGNVKSMTGFGTPFDYPLEPTTPDTATWTTTLDGNLAQYVNVSMTWSASSASNTVTLKQLLAWGWN